MERWLPGGVVTLAERHRTAVIIAVVAVLVAIGTAIVLATRQPVVETAPALPPAISAGPSQATTTTTAAPPSLVVSVVGRVERPGLVTLPTGARVADAVQAAGGIIPDTNDTALNLARRLADGEQIYVGIPIPAQAEVDPGTDAGTSAGSEGSAPSAEQSSTVDINTAGETELETLPGIGPTMAQRILDWRGQHGHFDAISQLRDVQGIGPGRYAKLAKLVTT